MTLRLFLCLVLLSVPCWAEVLAGRVVGVTDGDTITVLSGEKKQTKIRLFGLDAPESRQAFGARAKQALSEIVFDKQVRVEVTSTDRYGRSIGRVFVDQMDINLKMVRDGYAWWYVAYARKAADLAAAEKEARDAKRGLWADKDPTPPWEFRRAR